MSDEDQNATEREIMQVMRKVLAQIIKDTTPPSRAMKHPLTPSTIDDIRNCLGMIAARERELADLAGLATEKPYYADEKPAAEVVSIKTIGRAPKSRDD